METKISPLKKTFGLQGINFFLVIIMLVFLLWKSRFLPEKVPFSYSRPWGEDQLADKNYLFFFPGLSLLFGLLNLAYTKFFSKKEDFFLAFLGESLSLLFAVLNLIALVKIVFLIA
ncbi:MAG: hypothetical protein M1514_01700 [Patescibacteria group bacterium]|nr:hypothetical protein [Patescibacteria group bacterium]